MIGLSVGDEGSRSWQSVLESDELVKFALEGVGGASDQVIVAALLGILETLKELVQTTNVLANTPNTDRRPMWLGDALEGPQ